jgi:DNA-binding LacI/PurR family transcriptional regulator
MNIKDIARYAEVSPATVSRVIHNNGYVSNQKRKIVEKTLEQFNYVPNKIAQGLRKQKTGMIGYLVPSTYPNPFHAEISQGVDYEGFKNNYQILTLHSYGKPEYEERQIEEMVSRMVDGVIISNPASAENVNRIIEMKIPAVIIERNLDFEGIDKIVVNYIKGSYDGAKHMIELNHRDIAFLGVKPLHQVEIQRYQGFLNALEEKGIKPKSEYIKFGEAYSEAWGVKLMEELLTEKVLPSAIFIASDFLAIGVLQVLYKHNIRIPEDISIIGYDNTYSGILSPPISTVAIPMQELGKTAVTLILDKISSGREEDRTIRFDTLFIDRGTVIKKS